MNHVRQAHGLRLALADEQDQFRLLIERVEQSRRKIPMSRGAHTRGWHPVRRGHGAIAFESRLERKVIDALATHDALVSLQSQPMTVTYWDGLVSRHYTPDFLVCLTRVPDELARLGFGEQTYLEVKPLEKALADRESLARRFAALSAATPRPAVLVTEWDLAALAQAVSYG